MTELLTAAQMREIEQAAIESGEITGLELMERAGQGVVNAIFEDWPELAGKDGGAAPEHPGYLSQTEKHRRAVVLCGPGNNGGDGFVAARYLSNKFNVSVFLTGKEINTKIAQENFSKLKKTKAKIYSHNHFDKIDNFLFHNFFLMFDCFRIFHEIFSL